MDFTDKLLRFGFDGDEDSVSQGIYLSSTTPSNPPQSLAMFMDQGKIQSVKGEVVGSSNGSKKITTQFDLSAVSRTISNVLKTYSRNFFGRFKS